MNIQEKERLAMLGDMSARACGLRLASAREAAGLSQKQLAELSGHGANQVNNMEKARQHPNREIIRYLYRAHRIDFNFILHGDFAQLPSDVQDRLFASLQAAVGTQDRTIS
jgi:transcriptional regulator with XRE-family HTH domain